MPWTDSYFLSRFRSHDSEGGKKGKNEEEVENCEKLVEKKEGAMLGRESREKNGKTSRGRCRAMCVEEPKLPFLFFFFFFFFPPPPFLFFRLHISVLSYRGVLLVPLWVSVKLQRLRPSKQTSKLSRRTLRSGKTRSFPRV